MSGILGGDDGVLGSTPSGSENNYVASLGRISGKALSENLERHGVDLAFENDLLYLKVSPIKVGTSPSEDGDPNPTVGVSNIGINTDSPVYTLDVNNDIRSTYVTVTNQANIDNIIMNAAGYFSTTVGPIEIYDFAQGTIPLGRMTSDYLIFNDNYIASILNSNIIIDPHGTGNVKLNATTNVTGDVGVSGNITMNGNLKTDSNIIIGDKPLDTVTIVPDFTQSIIPGDDNMWSLGENTGDSSPRRWAQLHVPDWTHVGLFLPRTITVSDQTKIDGNNNTIFALQSNEDILLSPDTGINYIEQTKWQDDTITNLLNTPITFANTGIGYVRFMGNNGFVMPAGTTAEQRPTPELGETRWNTDLDYLECWDGTQWVISTGGGEEITVPIMEDLGDVYALILG